MDISTVPLHILLPILLGFVSKGAGDNVNNNHNSEPGEKITRTPPESDHV